MPYLPYHEPPITTLLSLTSFLLLLNTTRYIFNHLLYCGLVAEILIGIIWGLPVSGTSLLSLEAQSTVQSLGYLGLIGLVFEGGLETDMKLLKKSMGMSISVATVGLIAPIASSFLLLVFPFGEGVREGWPTPLAGFSAGAALCSTSLGTTFVVLGEVGMQKTRAGTILVGAAMMDDVVGLVMVNIVTTLGEGSSKPWPIARPIVASFSLMVISIFLAHFVFTPTWPLIIKYLSQDTNLEAPLGHSSSQAPRSIFQNRVSKLVYQIPHLGFCLSTLVLIIYVTIAAFINASVLFAAFIAGGMVSFLWTLHPDQQRDIAEAEIHGSLEPASKMFHDYFRPLTEYVLVPFFFASIGFSIPITQMFKGSILWKGIIYAILMIIAKALVGSVIYFEYFLKRYQQSSIKMNSQTPPESQQPTIPKAITSTALPTPPPQHRLSLPPSPNPSPEALKPPHSTALLISLAMVSRGEIGFLIASLAQSSNAFTLRSKDGTRAPSSEELFIVVIWGVVICTIFGPVAVGVVARRIKSDS
ncbi:hypothetical protein HYFRA_00002127 [Hymenoscyphus fraxineus]|uniref:Cation/H+ exchanger transmembrane domain-containing protein n=1 Tax=Hymenoscyphus fraxineus TaxID=746836 RepID=A0A9N9KKM7_9HELO|nr:hypothetical protein HYFRA_00002127 [Hymenoscyphus fraxineus]